MISHPPKPEAPANQAADPVRAKLQQALALHQQGQLAGAKVLYEAILKLQPDHFDALHLSGVIASQTRNYRTAIALMDRALEINPKVATVYYNRANALRGLGQFEAALAGYDKAIAINPDYAEAYNHRGLALNTLGQFHAALASYDKAISLKPGYAEAHFNRGNTLKDLEQFEAALASYDKAIALKPGYAEAHNNRGNALKRLKQPAAALASFDRVLALKPDNAATYNNRGNVLRDLGQFDAALASYDKAISLRQNYAEAYSNRGAALRDVRQFDAALASLEHAVAIKPDYAEAYWAISGLQLLAGDYIRGWQLNEWRWRSETYKNQIRKFDRPLWLGEQSIAGKTLLIHAEVGLGDTMQLCRYLPMAEALGADVVLEVDASLVRLMSTLKGNIRVVRKGDVLPNFDLHCPAMSLPLAFKTTLATIPAEFPYLYPEPDKQRIWRQRLGNKTRPRAGLVWSGQVGRDIDSTPAKNRSIPFQLLDSLLQLPMEFHSLQKDIRPDDAAVFELACANGRIQAHQKELNDFSDTAALISELDLIISIDTSVAHLAGALGQPLRVLLPYSTDYRWTLDGAATPWYPAAKLFRQEKIGDWEGVLDKVKADLERW